MTDTPRAIIAGTGRAGTSFLVRWLGACGVPVGDLDELAFNDRARAGLERKASSDDATYLVKDPWLYEYLHTLDDAAGNIEALIVPVRQLRHAALSRARQERATLIADTGVDSRRETIGFVPGGNIYSLSVTDQERVLAVGQAKLIEWALHHQVPLYLLHYPRLVNDADYAVDSLSPWLLKFCSRDEALARFAELAQPSPWMTDVTTEADTDDPERVTDLQIEIEALHLALAEARTQAQADAADHERQLIAAAQEHAHLEELLARTRDDLMTAQSVADARAEHAATIQAQLAAVQHSKAYRVAVRLSRAVHPFRR